MLHNLILEGPAFRIRPIADTDAPLVVSLRSQPGLVKYLHSISPKHEDQIAWLNEYYKRDNDYYFVVESLVGSTPHGLISIYNIDTVNCCAEWGRWILRPGSLAAIESAWLIYRCAFESLKLHEVYCRTVAENERVVSFHDSCGISKRSILPEYFCINSRRIDAVEHRLDFTSWQNLEPRLQKLVNLTAARFLRG